MCFSDRDMWLAASLFHFHFTPKTQRPNQSISKHLQTIIKWTIIKCLRLNKHIIHCLRYEKNPIISFFFVNSLFTNAPAGSCTKGHVCREIVINSGLSSILFTDSKGRLFTQQPPLTNWPKITLDWLFTLYSKESPPLLAVETTDKSLCEDYISALVYITEQFETKPFQFQWSLQSYSVCLTWSVLLSFYHVDTEHFLPF